MKFNFRRRSKYRAIPVTVNGQRFASKKEYSRYLALQLLKKAGKISGLKTQVPFELQPAFDKDEKHYRAIKYVADFVYTENGRQIVEDLKGFKTKEFLLKQKLFEYKFPDLTLKITS